MFHLLSIAGSPLRRCFCFFFLVNMGAHHSVGLEHLLINIQPAERKLRSYGEVEHAFGIFENFLLSVTFPIVGI